MVELSYDLHIHSCLSPCGDVDMTPGNIVGMAALKGLDLIAVTDHNSCRNCAAVLKLAEEYGMIALPGMELCTAEEVHVVCLFSALEDAISFDSYVYEHLPRIPNKVDIFGSQLIMNEKDEVIGQEPYLLINATTISFQDVYSLVEKYHGIMIPAHIDKNSNSLLANLGFIPPDSKFTCAEIHNSDMIPEMLENHSYLKQCRIIIDSDAHYLEYIKEPKETIFSNSKNKQDIIQALSSK